jgi:hypothetical protein
MDSVRHAVLSEHLQERLASRRVLAAVFTTFQFDPDFFEKQVLPVVLDVPVSHLSTVRLAQLEDVLRTLPTRIAVYYDSAGLQAQEGGSARLDIQRTPVRLTTGIFHPKVALILTESIDADAAGHRSRSLVIAAMSANLTRAGWWENVEACHVEELPENAKTRLRDDLLKFLGDIRRRSPHEPQHVALDSIVGFVRGSEQRTHRSIDDRLLPHFYGGRARFVDFLDDTAGPRLHGAFLEILSPYWDDAQDSKPLLDLLERFEPKETRLLLPRATSGEVACNEGLYKRVSRLKNVRWCHLPQDMLRLGRHQDSGERFVHAKLYRFFRQSPKEEICFVGSANLTLAAHSGKGNVEAGFLIELDTPRRPEFWLEPDDREAKTFVTKREDEPSVRARASRLMVRFRWDSLKAEAYWDHSSPSPDLELRSKGVPLVQIDAIPGGAWTALPTDTSQRLAEELERTSLLEVYGETDLPTTILVQEEGMSHKPSLLMQLSVADILRSWSLLTPEQRAAFLETHAPEASSSDDGLDLVVARRLLGDQPTLFDRFAGYFHAFNCLDQSVRKAIADDRDLEACYRLFGRKYDSLGTLMDRVQSGGLAVDDVDRYILYLCAKQLVRDLQRDFAEFNARHTEDWGKLDCKLESFRGLRDILTAKDPATMAPFLEWFERWFLRRATPSPEGVT